MCQFHLPPLEISFQETSSAYCEQHFAIVLGFPFACQTPLCSGTCLWESTVFSSFLIMDLWKKMFLKSYIYKNILLIWLDKDLSVRYNFYLQFWRHKFIFFLVLIMEKLDALWFLRFLIWPVFSMDTFRHFFIFSVLCFFGLLIFRILVFLDWSVLWFSFFCFSSLSFYSTCVGNISSMYLLASL